MNKDFKYDIGNFVLVERLDPSGFDDPSIIEFYGFVNDRRKRSSDGRMEHLYRILCVNKVRYPPGVWIDNYWWNERDMKLVLE